MTKISFKNTGILRFITIWFLIWNLAGGSVAAQSASPSKSPATSKTDSEPKLTAGNVDSSKYPSTTVNFTIEKEGTVFRQLETSDVEVLVDGKKVSLKPDALRKEKDSDAVRVLFVIDKSGSMKIGADKLQAAKDAINHFVGNLSPNDQVAVSTFGESYTKTLSLTKVENRTSINQAINTIEATDKFTNFYDSVGKSVEQANSDEVKNIIFLSDGKEDNAEFNSVTNKAAKKRESENKLIESLNDKSIRFFSVAIGNPEADPSLEEYVDYESMKNISDKTQGKPDLVNMPLINDQAKNDKAKSQSLIAEQLKGQLAEIKKALKFSYALVFDLPRDMKNSGEMVLNFLITDGVKKWKQTTTYPYTMLAGKPIFERANVKPFLLSASVRNLSIANVTLIFLLMILPLGFLSTIPAIFNKFAAVAEERKVNEAILNLQSGSQMIGKQCPNESGSWGRRFAFKQDDTVIICPQCGVPHHLTCWVENKSQCMNRICESRYQIPETILKKYSVKVLNS